MRTIFFIPLALFLFFAGLAGYMLTQEKNQTVASAMIDKALPEFDLEPAYDGLPGASRADFIGGEPKLLNIWASWCLPCIAEAPQLEALKEEGVEIIGIAIRDTPEDVTNFLDRHGNPYTRIGADDISALQIEIGAAGVPETFVIDGEGSIRYQHIGDIRENDVPKLLQVLEDVR
ncbi:DsbE family thiol:disulfide interchange protein [Erythrobacter rubeus]|uniref:DsbE family thiol:disulfide interchange protein n=1 Tax=Erythrobacter rubeus TaxID=2760803 RepID=A0ABR8KQI9_9SPHN|nr:DsbE family thiol:disulfide interchange protein [Erythrobacter rubeus]MBD2842174.1 DsbE family thiol:disulfide interchange protein [Erythrobacter rubeus]